MYFDTVYYNGTIITGDGAIPKAKWVATRNGKIEAIGSGQPPCENARKALDLQGKTVLPGLIDSHAHGVTTGFCLNAVGLGQVTCIEAVLELISEACRTADREKWVFAVELNPFALKERRMPTRFELDQVSEDLPVLIVSMTFHGIAVNTRAMELIQVPDNMPGVEKDESGTILGVYTSDESSFLGLSRALGLLEDEELKQYIRDCAQLAVEQGVTTLHSLDGRLVDKDRDFFIWLNMADTLPVHSVNYLQSTNVNLVKALGLPRIGGCLTLDGTGFEKTMAISEPFACDPSTNGVLYWTDEEVYRFVAAAHKAGLQCGMHALGDRAIDQLLNAHMRVRREQGNPLNLRHRIEHFSMCTQKQIETAVELGMILVMQPVFAYLWDNPEIPGGDAYLFSVGEERARMVEPVADVVKAGGIVAGSSDSAVTPINPLLGIHAVVNSKNPHRALPVEDALKLYTINGAIAAGEEAQRGSVEIGKWADFTVLDNNPFEDPGHIKDFHVEMTIVEDKAVYVRKQG